MSLLDAAVQQPAARRAARITHLCCVFMMWVLAARSALVNVCRQAARHSKGAPPAVCHCWHTQQATASCRGGSSDRILMSSSSGSSA